MMRRSYWKAFGQAAGFMVFLYASQGWAADVNVNAVECTPPLEMTPVVAVFTDKVPVTTVHIESGKSIRKMVDDAYENFPGTQWKSKTIAEFDFKSAFGIAFDPVPGNRCFFIKTVEINFGIRKHDIYIPSEYAVGSCPYQALLGHETEHVQAQCPACSRLCFLYRYRFAGLGKDIGADCRQ